MEELKRKDRDDGECDNDTVKVQKSVENDVDESNLSYNHYRVDNYPTDEDLGINYTGRIYTQEEFATIRSKYEVHEDSPGSTIVLIFPYPDGGSSESFYVNVFSLSKFNHGDYYGVMDCIYVLEESEESDATDESEEPSVVSE